MVASLTHPRLSVLLLPGLLYPLPPQDGSKPISDTDIMSLRGTETDGPSRDLHMVSGVNFAWAHVYLFTGTCVLCAS